MFLIFSVEVYCGRNRIVVLQLPMQSVPITTKVVSWNTAQARCTRFNIM